MKLQLFLEEIVKGLTVTVSLGRCRTAPLLFDEDLGLEKCANVVGALVRHAYLDRFHALITRRGIEVQAVATGVKIRSAILALVGNLDLIDDLNLSCAVVTSRDQVKARLDTASYTFGPRWRFGLPLSITVLITGLTVLSIHRSPS